MIAVSTNVSRSQKVCNSFIWYSWPSTHTCSFLLFLSYGGGCRDRTRVCRGLRHSLRFKRSALPLGQPSTNLAEADGVEPSSPLTRHTSLRMRQACRMPNASLAEETGLEPVRALRREPGFQPGAIPFRSLFQKVWQWERELNPRIPHQDGHDLANRHITALSSHCIDTRRGIRTHTVLFQSAQVVCWPLCALRWLNGQTTPASWASRANLVQAEGLEPSMFSAWVGRVTADCRRRWATPAW